MFIMLYFSLLFIIGSHGNQPPEEPICWPKFNELNTIFPLRFTYFNRFLELTYSHCNPDFRTTDHQNYRILVIDSKHHLRKVPAVIFHASLTGTALRKLTETNSKKSVPLSGRHSDFCISTDPNTNELMKATKSSTKSAENNDLEQWSSVTEDIYKANELIGRITLEEASWQPIAFLLFLDKKTDKTEKLDMRPFRYFNRRGNGGDMTLCTPSMEQFDLIFHRTVDVLLIAKNDTHYETNGFIDRLRRKVPKKYDINIIYPKKSHVERQVVPKEIDIAKGLSYSKCKMDDEGDNVYSWVVTTDTPGSQNNCDYGEKELLRTDIIAHVEDPNPVPRKRVGDQDKEDNPPPKQLKQTSMNQFLKSSETVDSENTVQIQQQPSTSGQSLDPPSPQQPSTSGQSLDPHSPQQPSTSGQSLDPPSPQQPSTSGQSLDPPSPQQPSTSGQSLDPPSPQQPSTSGQSLDPPSPQQPSTSGQSLDPPSPQQFVPSSPALQSTDGSQSCMNFPSSYLTRYEIDDGDEDESDNPLAGSTCDADSKTTLKRIDKKFSLIIAEMKRQRLAQEAQATRELGDQMKQTVENSYRDQYENGLLLHGSEFLVHPSVIDAAFKNPANRFFKPVEAASNGHTAYLICTVCRDFADKNSVNAIYFSFPTMADNKAKLLQLMREHLRSATHASAIQKYEIAIMEKVKLISSRLVGDLVHDSLKTQIRFKLVYAAVKLVLPMNKFPAFLNYTEKATKMSLGRLHRTRHGYLKMVHMVYRKFKAAVINSLARTAPTKAMFAVMLDATSTSDGRHLLLINVRFVSDAGFVVTKPMALFQMTKSETGAYVKDILVETFKNCSIEAELANNIVSVSTDSASTVAGEVDGFRGLFRTWVEEKRTTDKNGKTATKLIFTSCFAHRLELAVTHCYDEKHELGKWRKLTTSFVNKLHHFFGTMSHKRKEWLDDVQKIFPQRFLKLKKIITVRWSAHELSAINALIRDYGPILRTLFQIAKTTDKKWKVNDKNLAMSYYLVLKEPKFFGFLVFQHDFLSKSAIFSKQLQSDRMSADRTVVYRERYLQEVTSMSRVSISEDTLKVLQLARVVCRKTTMVNLKKITTVIGFDKEECVKELMSGFDRRMRESKVPITDLIHIAFEDSNPDSEDFTTALFSTYARHDTAEEKKMREEFKAEIENETNKWKGKQVQGEEETKEKTRELEKLQIYKGFNDANFKFMDEEVRKQFLARLKASIDLKLTISEDFLCFRKFDFDELRPNKMDDADAIKCRKEVYEAVGTSRLSSSEDAEKEFRNMAKYLDNPPADLAEDFAFVKEDHYLFLPLLKKYPDELKVTNNIIQVMEYIMTVTVTSASVERGFSILNSMADPRRSRTATEHWEMLHLIYSMELEELPDALAKDLASDWRLKHNYVDQNEKRTSLHEHELVENLKSIDNQAAIDTMLVKAYGVNTVYPIVNDAEDDIDEIVII